MTQAGKHVKKSVTTTTSSHFSLIGTSFQANINAAITCMLLYVFQAIVTQYHVIEYRGPRGHSLP